MKFLPCHQSGYAVKCLLCSLCREWVYCELAMKCLLCQRMVLLLNVCCVEGGYAVKCLLCRGWLCREMLLCREWVCCEMSAVWRVGTGA